MTLNIKIEKNDFEKPTEIREAIVQTIVDYFMHYKVNEEEEYRKTFYVKNTDVIYTDGTYLRAVPRTETNVDGIRVHSVEMDVAIDVMKKAGYHFYASYCITNGEHGYMFSKYLMNGWQETPNLSFGLCID